MVVKDSLSLLKGCHSDRFDCRSFFSFSVLMTSSEETEIEMNGKWTIIVFSHIMWDSFDYFGNEFQVIVQNTSS